MMSKFIVLAAGLLIGSVTVGAAWANSCTGANQCQCTTSAGTKYCGVKSGSGCACEVK